MVRRNLTELARRLAAGFGQTSEANTFIPNYRKILTLLSSGKPLTPKQISETIGVPYEEVSKFLRKLPSAELDRKGNLVGMGLTLNPTSHKFIVNSHTLYTWCALDALMFPALIEKPARVESPCRTTGFRIRVDVTPTQVSHLDPTGAVVSLVVPQSDNVDVRQAFCEYVHFFSSRKAASHWLTKHPEGIILSVSDAFKVGRIITENLLI